MTVIDPTRGTSYGTHKWAARNINDEVQDLLSTVQDSVRDVVATPQFGALGRDDFREAHDALLAMHVAVSELAKQSTELHALFENLRTGADWDRGE